MQGRANRQDHANIKFTATLTKSTDDKNCLKSRITLHEDKSCHESLLPPDQAKSTNERSND